MWWIELNWIDVVDQMRYILGSVTYSNKHITLHTCTDLLKNFITSSVPGAAQIHAEPLQKKKKKTLCTPRTRNSSWKSNVEACYFEVHLN